MDLTASHRDILPRGKPTPQHQVQTPTGVATTGLGPLHSSTGGLRAEPLGPRGPVCTANPRHSPKAPSPSPSGVSDQPRSRSLQQESQEALPCTSPASPASREEQEAPTSRLGAAPVRGWRGARAPPWRAGPCKLHPVGPTRQKRRECISSPAFPDAAGKLLEWLCRVKHKPCGYQPLPDACHCQ